MQDGRGYGEVAVLLGCRGYCNAGEGMLSTALNLSNVGIVIRTLFCVL